MGPAEMGERGRRWCLFTCAGDRSALRRWGADDPRRRWDLVLGYYGDSEREYAELSQHADFAFRDKGGKYQILRRLMAREPDLFSRYDYVWVCDDDIEMTPIQIDEAFAITERFEFWVAQPAFDPSGKISHAMTRSVAPRYDYRLVNFVEEGVPIFRRDKLDAFLAVYDGSLTGWGIAYWYVNVLRADSFARFAIIDRVSVRNPHDADKGGVREVDLLQPTPLRVRDWLEVKKKHNLVEFPHRVFACCRLVPEMEQRDVSAPGRRLDPEFLHVFPAWTKLRDAAGRAHQASRRVLRGGI